MATSSTGGTHESAPAERKSVSGDPGAKIPTRPEDTNASGDAKNDTGEDNQRDKQ
jgi:hypothetical protein